MPEQESSTSTSGDEGHLAALKACVVEASSIGKQPAPRTARGTTQGADDGPPRLESPAAGPTRAAGPRWGAGITEMANARIGSVTAFYGSFEDGAGKAEKASPAVSALLCARLDRELGEGATADGRAGGEGADGGAMAGGEGREGGANLGTDSVWDPHSRKRRYPWDPYDADGSGCRLYRKTSPGAPLSYPLHSSFAGDGLSTGHAKGGPGKPWSRGFRQLTPKLGKGDGIDEGKLRAQCQAVAVSMGQTGGPVASVASPAPAATLPAAGTVVRDGRSGDVEYGPKRHGVTDGARVAEVLCGGRVT